MKTVVSVSVLLAVVLLSGCSTYITPSGRADFAAFTTESMQESFDARPAARFPAALAFVRVQAPGYYSYYTDQEGLVYGRGRYSIVSTREVEEAGDLARIAALRQVAGVVGLNRLLLAPDLNSDRELREAAARLKADMVVIYTFDTSFHGRNRSGPLTVISLGMFATRDVTVNVTASALVMDTRTGFLYGAFETNELRDLNASLWSERQKADLARQEAESAAFKKLVDEFEKSWGLIIDRATQGA